MSNSPNTSTGRAILKAVRASLLLVSSSSELLTHSQLLVIRNELDSASAIVDAQIQAMESGGERLIIDISDWEFTSDEEEEKGGGASKQAKRYASMGASPNPTDQATMG